MQAEREWNRDAEDQRVAQPVGEVVARAGAQRRALQRRARAARALRGTPDTSRRYIESGALTPTSASVRARALFAARQSASRASRSSRSSARILHSV